jgi:predicted ABC-type ATPase
MPACGFLAKLGGWRRSLNFTDCEVTTFTDRTMPLVSNHRTKPPTVIVLGGANGAGKSTSASALLRGKLAVTHFVNADTIAQGLAAFAPESAAIEAGRIMLERIRALAASRATFAFETTLASRSLAPWLRDLLASGYRVHLVFLWLPSIDLAVARVADRVRMGGHNIPETTIRRRYLAGLKNFWTLYRPIATSWRVYNNSEPQGMRLLASGLASGPSRVYDAVGWKQFELETRHDA